MTRYALLLLLLLTAPLSGFRSLGFKVTRTMTDAQIERVERRVFKRYKTRADIRVISRNEQHEITNLEVIRYKEDGTKASSCSSDKFGLLIVTETGCQIADQGYEEQLKKIGK